MILSETNAKGMPISFLKYVENDMPMLSRHFFFFFFFFFFICYCFFFFFFFFFFYIIIENSILIYMTSTWKEKERKKISKHGNINMYFDLSQLNRSDEVRDLSYNTECAGDELIARFSLYTFD